MSADQDSDIKTIYVHLLDEGTTVLRPTQGESMGGGIYRLLPTPDYDADDESWEFLPGTIVRCTTQISDGEEIVVARESVA
jgi:hypothetical protein